MSSTIKNALIFLSIGLVLILVYVFFIRQPATQEGLVTIPVDSLKPSPVLPSSTPIDEDFLPLLLSVKSMTLSDAIFKNKAFERLVDVSVDLTPDGTEGRANPFALFSADETYAPDANSNIDTPEEDIVPPPSNTTNTNKTNTQNNNPTNIPMPPSVLPKTTPPKSN
jgi:hypothetical protein